MTNFNNLNNIRNAQGQNYQRLRDVIKNFENDAAASKVMDSISDKQAIQFDVVDTDNANVDIYDVQHEDGKTQVTFDMADINTKAEEAQVDPEIFLAQQFGSILAGLYIRQDAMDDGQSVEGYDNNAEFKVAQALVADGFVNRTYGNADVIGDEALATEAKTYMEDQRAGLDEQITTLAESGGIETGESDAFERLNKLGFKGLIEDNDGDALTWADDYVAQFGLDEAMETDPLPEDSVEDDEDSATLESEAEETNTEQNRTSTPAFTGSWGTSTSESSESSSTTNSDDDEFDMEHAEGVLEDSEDELASPRRESTVARSEGEDSTDEATLESETENVEETETAHASTYADDTEQTVEDKNKRSFIDEALGAASVGLATYRADKHSDISTIAQVGLGAGSYFVNDPTLRKVLPAASLALNFLTEEGSDEPEYEASPEYNPQFDHHIPHYGYDSWAGGPHYVAGVNHQHNQGYGQTYQWQQQQGYNFG